jgi:hypothetical protein
MEQGSLESDSHSGNEVALELSVPEWLGLIQELNQVKQMSESLLGWRVNISEEVKDLLEASSLSELVEVIRDAFEVGEEVVPEHGPYLPILGVLKDVLDVIYCRIVLHGLLASHLVVLDHCVKSLDDRA